MNFSEGINNAKNIVERGYYKNHKLIKQNCYRDKYKDEPLYNELLENGYFNAEFVPWNEFCYEGLKYLPYTVTKQSRENKSNKTTYNNLVITLDTETTKLIDNVHDEKYKSYWYDIYNNKRTKYVSVPNKIIWWNISIGTWFFNDKNADMEIFTTIYGHNPFDLCKAITRICENLEGNQTTIYVHNLPYDYTFLKSFFKEAWNDSVQSLFVDSNKPLFVTYCTSKVEDCIKDKEETSNKYVCFKDSYQMYNAKLATFCKNMQVETPKETTDEHNKFRCYADISEEYKHYALIDTVSLAQCIQNFAKSFNNKHGCKYCIHMLPLTQTGIPRAESWYACNNSKTQKKYQGVYYINQQLQLVFETPKDLFQYASFKTVYDYIACKQAFTGGYTRCNIRYYQWKFKTDTSLQTDKSLDSDNTVWLKNGITAYDFASSYPFVMVSRKFPLGEWKQYKTYSYDKIINTDIQEISTISLVHFKNIRLKDKLCGYPYLQLSKMLNKKKLQKDSIITGKELYKNSNGRITEASEVWIYYTNVDLHIINKLYDFDEVEVFHTYENIVMDYLPKPFTDYVWKCWFNKCEAKALKLDKSVTDLRKRKLNSLYGMQVQEVLQEDLDESEDLATYEPKKYYYKENPEGLPLHEIYTKEELDNIHREQLIDLESRYNKYLSNRKKILLYSTGMFITAYAKYRLFELIECCKNPSCFLYSDTDSVYAMNFDNDKINELNNRALKDLEANNYGEIKITDKEGVEHSFILGVAEFDGYYIEGKFLHSKCYIVRKPDNTYKITVSGVPKTKGFECLKDYDEPLEAFKEGFLFDGELIDKKLSLYHAPEDLNEPIQYDEYGEPYSFSIDMLPCSYLVSSFAKEFTDSDLEQQLKLYLQDSNILGGSDSVTGNTNNFD